MTFGLGMCAPKKTKRKTTPESLVLKAVLHYLAICRLGKVIRNNVGMVWTGDPRGGKGRPVRFGTRGQSDITVELSDSPIAIHVECKAKGNKPTPDQITWLDAQLQRGNLCIVAYSVEDVYLGLAAAGFEVPIPGGRKKKVAA